MRLCKADIACLCEMWGIAKGEQNSMDAGFLFYSPKLSEWNTEAGALPIFQAASIKVVWLSKLLTAYSYYYFNSWKMRGFFIFYLSKSEVSTDEEHVCPTRECASIPETGVIFTFCVCVWVFGLFFFWFNLWHEIFNQLVNVTIKVKAIIQSDVSILLFMSSIQTSLKFYFGSFSE